MDAARDALVDGEDVGDEEEEGDFGEVGGGDVDDGAGVEPLGFVSGVGTKRVVGLL